MTSLRIVLWAAFLLFTAVSIEVLWVFGPAGFLSAVLQNGATTLAMIDLTLALTMVLVVMIRDASARGRTVWPFVLLTLVLGSAGPLLYFALNPPQFAASSERRHDRVAVGVPATGR